MDTAASEALIPNVDHENEGKGGDCSTIDHSNCKRTRGILSEFFYGAFSFRVQTSEEDEQSIKTSMDCFEKVDLLEEKKEEEEEECCNKNELVSEKLLSSSNEKCKKSGSKRPPKPPLPPKGPLLDASDRKLLRELAEIAMRKRERIARLKALKRMRAAKGSSSSSKGNISAMIITLIFFLLMLFHGFGSKDNQSDHFEGSPMQARGFLSVHHYQSPGVNSPDMGDGGKRQRRHGNRRGGQRHRKIW